MSRARQRRPRTAFSFTRLPADVQVQILGGLDLASLQTTISAVPCARELFRSYPLSILHKVTAGMTVQIRNLLLTTFNIVSCIRYNNISRRPRFDNVDSMAAFLQESLDTNEQKRIDGIECDALTALHTLTEIDAEVSNLVRDYAQDIYRRMCNRDNPGAIPPPLELSVTEEHRITRAFYRLKLYGVLFYNFADHFRVNLRRTYSAFFDRLGAFEIDEMVCTYQFALRERRYFISACPHTNCMFYNAKPWRSRDPFNCEQCRGRYTFQVPPGSPTAWRSIQPFWDTLDTDYISDVGFWALPAKCRAEPLRIWDEVPGADEPNVGWLSWSKHRDSDFDFPRMKYTNDFRLLGYCFWDETRIDADWEGAFGQDWSSQTCSICNGPCDLTDEDVEAEYEPTDWYGFLLAELVRDSVLPSSVGP